MTETSNHLYHLLQMCQFSDSALPVGSFAFSNGLESALQLGIVADDRSLKDYILVMLRQSAFLDGIYVNHAYQFSAEDNLAGLIHLERSFAAKRVGEEQQLMSWRIGNKLAELYLRINTSEKMREYLALTKNEGIRISHPVVHGVVFQELSLSQAEAFSIYQYGTASMILSAAVRLMRIDHYQTQRILFEVNETVDHYFEQVKNMSVDETVSFAPVYDCLLAQHVNAHVRMFMN